MRFDVSFYLIGKSTMAFSTGEQWRLLKPWYTGGGLEQGFGAVSQSDVNKSLVPRSMAKANIDAAIQQRFSSAVKNDQN